MAEANETPKTPEVRNETEARDEGTKAAESADGDMDIQIKEYVMNHFGESVGVEAYDKPKGGQGENRGSKQQEEPLPDKTGEPGPKRLEKPIPDEQSEPAPAGHAPASLKPQAEGAAAGHAPASLKPQAEGAAAGHAPASLKPLADEAVTGHTAGLWKYMPVPNDEPEAMPEYVHRFARFPGGDVIAARVRGKKHKHEGTNCDDWYETANFGEIIFVAVSDGAGSKKFSRIGARESCKAAVGYLATAFKREYAKKPQIEEALGRELSDPKCMEACGVLAGIVQQSVIKAAESVEAAYYSRAADPAYEAVLKREPEFKDFSGTLLVAVLVPVGKGAKEHLAISCQVGDGMIALLNTRGEFASSLKLMGVADSGEFSGETDFLTSPQMKNIHTLQTRTKISRSEADLVMVMSDGVADDYFPNEKELYRLYYDLVINGIIEGKKTGAKEAFPVPRQLKILKKLPDPLAYPWVNDQQVKVPVQYTKRVCQSVGFTLEDIWNAPWILELARLELKEEEENQIADPSERLKIWLDNYVERGSFDDRTLVLVRL